MVEWNNLSFILFFISTGLLEYIHPIAAQAIAEVEQATTIRLKAGLIAEPVSIPAK